MPLSLYVIWVVAVFLLLHITTQAYKDVTLGESLTAGDTSPLWLSPSNNFAFGFRETEPGKFLLAIWCNKISEKTITWSANRDNLAPRGSKVTLSINRSLQLTDPKGQEIWQAGSRNDVELGSAAMLDTGNFVLTTRSSAVLWQSFDEPTDTLLPTQVLNPSAQLVARYSEMNFSSGIFSLVLQATGNAALYTTNFPLFESLNYKYLDFEDQGLASRLVFNQSGLLYLVARNGSFLTDIFSNSQQARNSSNLYQRVILDFDGVLRYYVYQEQSAEWSVKAFTPDNICTALVQNTGSGAGACGYNSYCQLENDGRPLCLCPPGYIQLDPNNDMSGCSQNFGPQSCEEDENNNFEFKVLQQVDWPWHDYKDWNNMTIDQCREVCLADCFCAVGIFNEDGQLCYEKKLPLSNGINASFVERTALVKVRIANGTVPSKSNSNETNISEGAKGRRPVIAIVLPLVALTVIIVLGVYKYMNKRKQSQVDKDIIHGAESMEQFSEFSLSTLRAATNDYSTSNELGRGGFGTVYKGRLLNGQEIAVKRLAHLTEHGEAEFKNEVQLVARLHHKNLIRLIGFGLGREEKVLVYELALNGSLDRVLFDPIRREQLNWELRYNIIEGIARGLLYLHEESQLRIIHRDLKASNVLLDEHMNPKISDFGTAKLFIEGFSSASKIVGTFGYMAPEYAKYGKLSIKSDVFSFGVLLLEIVSGKKNNSRENTKRSEHLLSTAWNCWKEGTLPQLIDPILLRENRQADVMMQCLHIGLLCVQQSAKCRPSMNQVILMLEGCSQMLPQPSEPAYLMKQRSITEEPYTSELESEQATTQPTTSSKGLPSSIIEVSFSNSYLEPR